MMETLWIYGLKVSLSLILSWVFFVALFRRDTHLQWRRALLLLLLTVSFALPLIPWNSLWKKPLIEPLFRLDEITVTPLTVTTATAPHAPALTWHTLLLVVYGLGVVILALRMMVQVFQILRLHYRCPQVTLQGIRVHVLPRRHTPFSFGQWIFLYPASHTEEELAEILTHEQTHTAQRHTLDVLYAECLTMLLWFHPLIWLIRREIRNNLEFLADRQVLSHGYNPKQYQYHLLQLTYPQSSIDISNNFNVLPLKKRIIMMNLRPSTAMSKAKYLLTLPLVACMFTFAQSEAKASVAPDNTTDGLPELTVVSYSSTPSSAQKPSTASTLPTATAQKDTTVFEVVEVMPEYPGGMSELMRFLAQSIKYPEKCQKEGAQGRVVVRFVVDKDGSVVQPEVVRGTHPDLDAEAIRVVKAMPKWKPGMQKGKVVRTRYTLPVTFRLNPTTPATPVTPAK